VQRSAPGLEHVATCCQHLPRQTYIVLHGDRHAILMCAIGKETEAYWKRDGNIRIAGSHESKQYIWERPFSWPRRTENTKYETTTSGMAHACSSTAAATPAGIPPSRRCLPQSDLIASTPHEALGTIELDVLSHDIHVAQAFTPSTCAQVLTHRSACMECSSLHRRLKPFRDRSTWSHISLPSMLHTLASCCGSLLELWSTGSFGALLVALGFRYLRK
jgi:hypothetical protein